MSTLVSVIIPTYNTANYIVYAIESVLTNEDANYEIIIVDDGSTDQTEKVIFPYLKHSFIRYIKQKNKGLAGARNTGIKDSNGKYLVFLDSDDIVLPGKLKIQSEFLENNADIDIVYSDSEWFIEDNFQETRSVNFPKLQGYILEELLYGNFVHVNSVMVRKDKVLNVGIFDEEFKELEDWDLWLRMVINGSKFGYLPGIFSRVRIRKGSMTSNQQKMNSTMVCVLEKTIQKLNMLYPRGDDILLKAYDALFNYKLKAKKRINFLSLLFEILRKQGLKFFPFAVKLIVKFSLGSLYKQNRTTKEIEKIWEKND